MSQVQNKLNISGKNVWVFSDTDTRWIWPGFCAELQKMGYNPILFVKDLNTKKYYTELSNPFFSGTVEIMPDIYSDVASGLISSDELSKNEIDWASTLENRFNISILRDFALPDKHFGRPYIISGEQHPDAHIDKKINYSSTVRSIKTIFNFYDDIWTKYPPSLLLTYSGVAGMKRGIASCFARDGNIPERYLFSARRSGYFYWGDDSYQSSKFIVRKFHEQPLPPYDKALALVNEIEVNVLASKKMRSIFEQKLSFYNIICSTAKFYTVKIYQIVLRKNRVKWGYKGISILMSLLRARKDLRWLKKYSCTLSKIPKNYKKVFFPLQQDPEQTTYVYAPYSTNQYEIIRELSLSVPSNAVILVKEHLWALGRRENGMYSRIRNLPNVYILGIDIESKDIIPEVDLVCSISSSFAHEAAMLGKRTLIFDKNTPLNVLPHVSTINSTGDLSIVRNILDNESDTDRHDRVINSARYINTIYENMSKFDGDVFSKNSKYNYPFVSDLIVKLERTLSK